MPLIQPPSKGHIKIRRAQVEAAKTARLPVSRREASSRLTKSARVEVPKSSRSKKIIEENDIIMIKKPPSLWPLESDSVTYVQPPIRFLPPQRRDPEDPAKILLVSTSKETLAESLNCPYWNWKHNRHNLLERPKNLEMHRQPGRPSDVVTLETKTPRIRSQGLKYPFKRYEKPPTPPPAVRLPIRGKYIDVLHRRNLVPSYDVNEVIPSSLFGEETELGALVPPPPKPGPPELIPDLEGSGRMLLLPWFPLTGHFKYRPPQPEPVTPERAEVMKKMYIEESEYVYNQHPTYKEALKRKHIRVPDFLPMTDELLNCTYKTWPIWRAIKNVTEKTPAPEASSK